MQTILSIWLARFCSSQQSTGATLVPAALAAGAKDAAAGDDAEAVGVLSARRVADRLIGWSTLIAGSLALAQWLAMPQLTPLFTPLEEVRAAVRRPAQISALVQLTNGPLFAGEGSE